MPLERWHAPLRNPVPTPPRAGNDAPISSYYFAHCVPKARPLIAKPSADYNDTMNPTLLSKEQP
jgi:hypothetical protein